MSEPASLARICWKVIRLIAGVVLVAGAVFALGIAYYLKHANPNAHCCVAEGTWIYTPDGARRIEALEAGDQVYSYDFAKRKWVANTVVETYTKVDVTWVEADLPGGTTLSATSDHLVYDTSTRTYRPIGDVATFAVMQDGRVGSAPPRDRGRSFGHETFHDLHLEGEPRNYLANGVVVHNKL